jgi:hypothetical protein
MIEHDREGKNCIYLQEKKGGGEGRIENMLSWLCKSFQHLKAPRLIALKKTPVCLGRGLGSCPPAPAGAKRAQTLQPKGYKLCATLFPIHLFCIYTSFVFKLCGSFLIIIAHQNSHLTYFLKNV